MRRRSGSGGWRVVLGVVLLTVGTAAPAAAAAPPNDNFADAVELTTPDAYAIGTTLESTVEPGEQGTGSRSVWYRFTAPSARAFGIDACEGYPDQLISVWTGTALGSLTAKHSGGCRLVAKPSAAGQVLHIRLRPLTGSGNRFGIRLRPAPENDDFPGTAVATTATGSPAVDTFAATRQAGEPAGAESSAWWSWQPAATASVAVADVCTDDEFDDSQARIEAFTGDTLSTLAPAADQAHLACREEYSGYRQDPDTVVRWTPAAGPARLRVGGSGLLDLRVRSGSPPAGDAFAAPREVSGSDLHEYYRTPFATAEAGEPQTDGTRLGAATVWFRWTPPGAGTAVFDACEGQSRIHAYRGTDLAALEPVTNLDYCLQRVPVGEADPLALQTGVGRLVEAHYLDLEWGAAPANDLFTGAEVLTGDAPTASGDVSWATRSDEPRREPGATVWYVWNATSTGMHAVDSCGSAANVQLRVSTGWSAGTQVPTGMASGPATGDPGQACKWYFDAVKGRNYRIRVLGDPQVGQTGAFGLSLERERGDGPRDFNGDGVDDLAIGIPDRAVGGDAGAGAVEIAYGRAGGTPVVAHAFTQDTYGVPDLAEPGDRFGADLTVADFDGDGFDDLAIASPGEAIGGVARAGAVHILRGSLDGLVSTGSQFVHKGSPGVPGNPVAEDAFGAALDGAPLDDTAGAELVVGAPGERNAVGGAYLFRGGGGGIDPATALRMSEDAGSTPGLGAAGERFGSSVAIGDDDIVIGVPNEDVGSAVDAGAVYLLPEAAPTGSGGRVVNQNKTGVPDTAESGDHFGAALATGPLQADADGGDVLIGAPEEDGSGTVTVLYNGERAPRTEAIRLAYPDAGGRFGSALDVSYGMAAIGAPGGRISTTTPTGAGLAVRMWIGPTYIPTASVAAFGRTADANVATDVVLLKARPVGGAEVFAGGPNVDVGGIADAGAVTSGAYQPFTLASPSPGANEHAGTSVGG